MLLRQGEVYGLGGGVGLPSGLSQKSLDETSPAVGGAAVLLAGSSTRAAQKLVSDIGFEAGRSIIKRPSSAFVQYPAETALCVHIYVFC